MVKTLRIKDILHLKLKKRALKDKISLEKLTEKILTNYLKNNEK